MAFICLRMFAPVIGAAYTMTTKREAHWSEQTKAQNTEKGMYVGLKQPRGDGERYVTPARAAAKETGRIDEQHFSNLEANENATAFRCTKVNKDNFVRNRRLKFAKIIGKV